MKLYKFVIINKNSNPSLIGTLLDLEVLVSKEIKQGWEPLGGITEIGYTIVQPMVKL
jgi:hypothetical protein